MPLIMIDPAAPKQLLAAIVAIHYASPVVTLVYFVTATTVSVCTLQTLSSRIKEQHVRRDVILWLVLGLVCGYLAQVLLVLIRKLFQKDWFPDQDEMVYLIASSLIWGIQFLSLMDTQFPVWYTYYVNWVVGVIVELALLFLPLSIRKLDTSFDYIAISIQSLRLFNFMILPCLYLTLRNRKEIYENDVEEQQSLLRSAVSPGPSSSQGTINAGYGATMDAESQDSNQTKKRKSAEATKKDSAVKKHDFGDDDYLQNKCKDEERMAKRLKEDGNWWTYAKGFAIFIPFLFPVHNRTLQLRALLVGLCLLAENGLNVLVPRQLGIVTDALVAGDGGRSWIAVSVYAGLSFVNSSACIGWLKFWLWQPVGQYSYNALNTAAYSHVMSLSSDFHEKKEPSEIHQAVFQGRSITGLVDTICFQVLPMFIDLGLVFAYLYYLFGPYMALNLAATTLFYLYTTTKLVSMAAARRRLYILYYRKEWKSGYSSLHNWRVASYFNNVPYEEGRYSSNVRDHLAFSKQYALAIKVISAAQGLIMTFGLLGGCMLAVYQVMQNIRSPGDFVILLSYWAQLRGPLGFFSNMYKDISESMMDAERLLEFFQTKPTIIDKETATALELSKGEVKFVKVNFSYDTRKPTLKEVDFTITGGSTVALVGETGSGKSTILKLLDRFYDVTAGRIEIDGQDIRDVTLSSLRDKIGVVPQDATLFNDTVMNNVRYSRLSATDEEVHDACRLAVIHDKIMSFPDGYESRVGNNGIKLSGGEQQRVAIARAILKKPQIILLDEATSSVDTETEQSIQTAFKALCTGRTTFIVAHRLSTIMGADRIMVVKDGLIIEDGSHDALILSRGKYYDLWAKQILKDPNESDTAIGSPSTKPASPVGESANIDDLDDEKKTLEIFKLRDDLGPGESDEAEVRSIYAALHASSTEFLSRHPRTENGEPARSAKTKTNQESKRGHRREKGQMRYDMIERKTPLAESKNTERALGKRPQGVNESACGSQRPGTVITPDSSSPTTESESKTKGEKSRSRRSRLTSHRPPSKTGQAGQGSMGDLIDSEETTAVSSGEGPPLSESGHNRRLSIPSDPPYNYPANRRQSSGRRSYRSRHPGGKNGLVEQPTPDAALGEGSSRDQSADDYLLPPTPATSPASDSA